MKSIFVPLAKLAEVARTTMPKVELDMALLRMPGSDARNSQCALVRETEVSPPAAGPSRVASCRHWRGWPTPSLAADSTQHGGGRAPWILHGGDPGTAGSAVVTEIAGLGSVKALFLAEAGE
jgi:hypothetical protein